jgi:hypothetical protein
LPNPGPSDFALFLYWRDNTRPERPWRPGGIATWGAGPVRAASLCSSGLGDGWLQGLTQEDTSIYHVYRYRIAGGFRWMRAGCPRLDDHSGADVDGTRSRSVKLAQVTGEPDAQHPNRATLSTSESTSGIRGTDLGVTVHHGNRTFLLFGDTHWVPGAADRPRVVLHGSPLRIVGGPVTDREYDVPLDAFSLAGQWFVFFSSDHFADHKVMGRSVLTRALDPALLIEGGARDRPLEFHLLTTLSDWRFINVSVQLRPATEVPGYGRNGHLLLIWGSGAYRSDDLRLALLDLRDPAVCSYLLDTRPFPIERLGLRYFTDLCGDVPLWSNHEADARPALWPCALGELSVRWVPEIDRYVLLAMSGPEDPMGAAVVMRTARRPWGPWSRRRQVFDWVLDGMGIRNRATQFIHNAGANPPDTVGDCIFPEQCNAGGGAYAPYLHSVGVDGETVSFSYTLSTWNPYQVMLLRHEVTLEELRQLERP